MRLWLKCAREILELYRAAAEVFILARRQKMLVCSTKPDITFSHGSIELPELPTLPWPPSRQFAGYRRDLL
jgi:hypothetical protein